MSGGARGAKVDGGRAGWHPEVLDRRRQAMLPALAFLRRRGFYLAGGTALAMQIGHRISVDFDFYAPSDFDPHALYQTLAGRLAPTALLHVDRGTLIATGHDVEMSFFHYAYPLLKPLVRAEHLDLASLEDLTAMKVIAIVQRGTRRDFVDLYYLLKQFEVEAIFRWTSKKYMAFNPYIGLRALTYFEDAEAESSRGRLRTFEPLIWKTVTESLVAAADAYRRRHGLHGGRRRRA